MHERARDRGGENGDKDEVALHAEHGRAVGEDERGEDVERSLLRHPRQRGQDNLHRLPPDHLKRGRLHQPVLRHELPEGRRLQNAKPDVKADGRRARC